jgi:peptidyl-prolyl cis-trans isomerase A (cyclophilin A)
MRNRWSVLGLIGGAALAGSLIAIPARAESGKPAEAAGKAVPVKDVKDAKKPAADGKDAAKPQGEAAKEPKSSGGTLVELRTTEGAIKIELADKEAPVSVKNFLAYVNDKFYDGTVFHRVIDGFMIQGGGYTVDGDNLSEKATKSPIANEAKNGLKNDRGALAMARTSNPDSATAQFFINLVNNDRLNYPNPDGHGYAVFGRVVEGLDVVDKIGKAKTGIKMGMADVPVTDIKILSASVVKPAGH